jgi:hypothetical protein
LSFAGSGVHFTRSAPLGDNYLLEHRMSRKSESVAFFIPGKEDFKEDAVPPLLPSLDVFLYSDAPALHFYRNPQTREAVIDFFVSLTGSEEVALAAMYYSDKHDIPFMLSFSLMHTESRFLPDAVNFNATSIDRGVFQLNNRAFPHLNEEDFFNPDLNASYGVSHLEWCISVSSSLDEALAIYNAGYGKVKSGVIPASTREYIRKIHRYREELSDEFYQYLVAEIPVRVLNLASLP